MANDITAVRNVTYSSAAAKFGGFGLATGVLQSAASTPVDSFGTNQSAGTGTIEAWVKTTATSTRVAAGRLSAAWIGMNASGFLMSAIGGGATFQSSTTKLNDGQWHHIALVVVSGSGGTLYQDGARLATQGAQTIASSAGQVFQVGNFGNPDTTLDWSGDGSGVVDEVRVSSTARYSGASFTAPTAAFTGDASTLALWHLENNGTDSTAVSADTTAPTAPTLTAVGGDTTAALSWSGATDNVAVTGYNIYRGGTFLASTTGTTYTNTGLTNGTAYTYTVKATDAAGNESVASNSVTVTPAAAGILPTDVNLVYSPVNWDVTSARAFTNCAGARVSALISGSPTAIAANFDVSSMVASNQTRIEYRVDGGPWTEAVLSAGSQALSLPASGAATRFVELMVKTSTESANRWASPYVTAVKFTGFTTTPANCVTVAMPASGLRVAVFGDSITEGINVLGTSGDTTARSDALFSYATQLGARLGAAVGVVGFGRQGLAVTGNGSVPVLGSSWKLQAAGIVRAFTPALDAVIVNMGTNDASNAVTAATFQAALTSLLNDMIATLPASTQIFVMLPFNGAYGASVFQNGIAASSTPLRVSFVDTTGWIGSGDTADGTHPWAYTGEALTSRRLASTVRGVLGAGRSFLNVGGVATRLDQVRI